MTNYLQKQDQVEILLDDDHLILTQSSTTTETNIILIHRQHIENFILMINLEIDENK